MLKLCEICAAAMRCGRAEKGLFMSEANMDDSERHVKLWDVLNCPLETPCTQQWDDLAPDETSEKLRHCRACQKPVYRCDSEEELNHHAAQGRCVSILVEDCSRSARYYLGGMPATGSDADVLEWG